MQSIVAAEVGYHELALRYFYAGLFVDLADRHGNTVDGVHVASTGGVWSALVAGFGGMRDHNGRLTFDPRLPQSWPSLTWQMRWQRSRLRVRLDREAITFVVEVGEPVTLSVRGEQVVVGSQEVRVPLDGQGPRRDGGPQLRWSATAPQARGVGRPRLDTPPVASSRTAGPTSWTTRRAPSRSARRGPTPHLTPRGRPVVVGVLASVTAQFGQASQAREVSDAPNSSVPVVQRPG